MTPTTQQKMSFWQIWNMSFGFFGIQFGWGLQMANMSAIYQYLGANESQIPILWLAAPVTGLIVQPILGYYSDRTWCFLGRRRPYFLVGAILASIALIFMPNASAVWMAAGLLWILDASVNVSMEPFRAFVGDKLSPDQRKEGFAMQSLLIGLGAVLSSSLPWVLTNVFGVVSNSETSKIPWSIHLAFYIGSAVFFVAVLYTILTTKETPPEDMEAFKKMKRESAGIGNAIKEITSGIFHMPKTMQQLALVQFFTWFGLYCLWIYFAPSIAKYIFNGAPGSEAYQHGVEWGGVCFSVYNGVAFVFAFLLLLLVKRFSAKSIHTVCLSIAGVGFLSILFIKNPDLLIISMIGIGIGWASILAMPYAILSNAIPPEKMGFYMGVFNFFIVLPQIVATLILGEIVTFLLSGNTMLTMAMGGISLFISAFLLRYVKDNH